MSSWAVVCDSDADCQEGSSSPTLTGTTVRCGHGGQLSPRWSFFRWDSCPIPQGSIITNATAWPYLGATWTSEFSVDVHWEDVDNSAAFGSSEDLTGRDVTTAYNRINPSSGAPGVQKLLGATNGLQELVNRPGYASGNSVCLIIKPYNSAKDDDHDLELAAVEHPTYTELLIWVAYTGPAEAEGALENPAMTMAGNVVVGRAILGAQNLPLISSSGQVIIKKTVSGTPSLPPMVSLGNASLIWYAEGTPSLPAFETGPNRTVLDPVRGAFDLPAISASGNIKKKIKIIAEGQDPSIYFPAMYMTSGVEKEVKTLGDMRFPEFQLAAGVVRSTETDAALVNAAMTMASKVMLNAARGAVTLPVFTMVGQGVRGVVALGSMTLPAIDMNKPFARGPLLLPAFTMEGYAQKKETFPALSVTLPVFTMQGYSDKTGVIESEGGLTLSSVQLFGGTGAMIPKISEGATTLPVISMSGVAGDRTAKTSTAAMDLPSFIMGGEADIASLQGIQGDLGLPSMVIEGEGLRKIVSVGDWSLGAFSMQGGTQLGYHAPGVILLPVMTAEGLVTVVHIAEGGLTLPAMTMEGATKPAWKIEGALVVNLPTLEGIAARAAVLKAGAITLPSMGISGLAELLSSAEGTLTLPGFEMFADARLDITSGGQWYRVVDIKRGSKRYRAIVEAVKRPTAR